jgi:hypothetical protein
LGRLQRRGGGAGFEDVGLALPVYNGDVGWPSGELETDVEATDLPTVKAMLREARTQLLEQPNVEIWVRQGEYPALCALVNGNVGLLMYVRRYGDAGFSSRNPELATEEASVSFVLGNGQEDEYPVAWTYPATKIFEALEVFASTQRVPPDIEWFNDAGDGWISPDIQGSPPPPGEPTDDAFREAVERIREAYRVCSSRLQRLLVDRVLRKPLPGGDYSPSILRLIYERNRGALPEREDRLVGQTVEDICTASAKLGSMVAVLRSPPSGFVLKRGKAECADTLELLARCAKRLDTIES